MRETTFQDKLKEKKEGGEIEEKAEKKEKRVKKGGEKKFLETKREGKGGREEISQSWFEPTNMPRSKTVKKLGKKARNLWDKCSRWMRLDVVSRSPCPKASEIKAHPLSPPIPLPDSLCVSMKNYFWP